MSPSADERVLRLLFWESTARCNLACVHCRRIETCGDMELSTSQAAGMLDELATIGRRQGSRPVIVFSGGEPLLRQDIFELISYAVSGSLTAALATNGTLIDSAVAARLKSCGVARVSVSIDGSRAATHDDIRGQAGSFEAAVSGVKTLRRKGVPFQLNFTLTRRNSGELADVYSLAESLGAEALHVFILVPVGCGRELADTEVLAPAEYELRLLELARMAVAGKIQVKVTCGPQYERVVRQHGLKSSIRHDDEHGPAAAGHGHTTKGCLAGTGVLFVSHKGTAFPCGYLPIDCGDVLSAGLSDIWTNSEPLKALRCASRLKGKCGACEYKHVCGGCRARAFAATGDEFAEEPSCGYLPGGRGGRA
jgi:AdoMet-dependent heme synthase